jgi:DNA-directed RNA polymerase specialized sigma24 family protein
MAENETGKPRGPCRPGDPDKEAVARMLDGHRAAEDLDTKYRDGLVNHAASSIGDRDRAKVVVQDSFADAFNNIGTFKGRSSFFTWLYGIFKYRLLKEQKAVVAAGSEIAFESESATRSGDPEDQRLGRRKPTGLTRLSDPRPLADSTRRKETTRRAPNCLPWSRTSASLFPPRPKKCST